MNILIVKPSSLGDVIQALPVLRLLRREFPEARIDWWVAKELAPIFEDDPDLDGCHPFFRTGWSRPAVWRENLRVIRQVRGRRFDWVLDLQGLARSGVFSWLAAGSLLVGLDDRREGAPGFYDRAVPRPSPQSHAIDWYLAVLRTLGVRVDWNFEWLPERRAVRRAMGEKWPVAGRRWVAVHPGARWSNKRWPAGSYADLVKDLAGRDSGLGFVILGGVADRGLGEEIAAAAPDRSLNLTGKTSLPEMIEWIRASALMVTNDTGPMHVAAAMKRPLVALFGPTNPRRTGPYGQLGQVIAGHPACAPCMKSTCSHEPYLECLASLSAERVAEAAWRRLQDLSLASLEESSTIRL